MARIAMSAQQRKIKKVMDMTEMIIIDCKICDSQKKYQIPAPIKNKSEFQQHQQQMKESPDN